METTKLAQPSLLLVMPAAHTVTESLAHRLREKHYSVTFADSPEMAGRCAEFGACIIGMSPATLTDSRIVAALKPLQGRLIPLFLEPMSLPPGHWATLPVLAQSTDEGTAQALAETITNMPAQPVPLGNSFMTYAAPEIKLPSQRYRRRRFTGSGIITLLLIAFIILAAQSCITGK